MQQSRHAATGAQVVAPLLGVHRGAKRSSFEAFGDDECLCPDQEANEEVGRKAGDEQDRERLEQCAIFCGKARRRAERVLLGKVGSRSFPRGYCLRSGTLPGQPTVN